MQPFSLWCLSLLVLVLVFARLLWRARLASGGTRWGLMPGRSALRADSTAMLALGSRRETPSVRFAHCGQTVPSSQSTKRAARAGPNPAMLATPEIAPTGYRLPQAGAFACCPCCPWCGNGARARAGLGPRSAAETARTAHEVRSAHRAATYTISWSPCSTTPPAASCRPGGC